MDAYDSSGAAYFEATNGAFEMFALSTVLFGDVLIGTGFLGLLGDGGGFIVRAG